MIQVLCGITGLLHAAQQGVVNHSFFWFSCCLEQQSLQFCRNNLVLDQLKFIAKAVDELLEIDQFCRIGIFMHAIKKRYVLVGNKGCHSFIGSQHEFFDQLMCQIALGADDPFGQAGQADDDLRLRQVEIDTAPFFAHSHQDQGQLLHLQ